MFAATVNLGNTGFLHYSTGVEWCYAGTCKNGYTASGLVDELSDSVDALLSIGATTRCEESMAAAPYKSLKGFRRWLTNLVKSTVERHLQRCRQPHYVTCATLVHAAILGEEPHHHSMGTRTATQLHFTAYLSKFLFGIDKIACPWAHQHMSTKVQLFHTIKDILFGRSGPA